MMAAIASQAELDDLVEEIVSPVRERTIVALTSRKGNDTPALDPEAVQQELGDEPEIIVIADGPLTRRLADRLTRELAVYGGAARIWWPGTTRDSDPRAHPLIFERHGVYGSLALRRLADAYRLGPTDDSSHGRDSVTRAALDLEKEARAGAEALVTQLRAELGNAREEVERLRRRVHTLQQQVTDLRTENRAMEKTVKARSAAPTDPSAREWFLRDTIMAVTEEIGGAVETQDVRFGQNFVASTLDVDAPAERIAWVCAFVLTRSPEEMTGLDLHPLRTGFGGSDPQTVRVTDGAKAWRLALRRNTPGAPRLHFWRLPDGGVEFADTVHHDVMSIS